MNLGQLIGQLLLEAEVESIRHLKPLGRPSAPTHTTIREHVQEEAPDGRRKTGITAAIREILRKAVEPMTCAELVQATGFTAMQVSTNVGGMRDVEHSGQRGSYRYWMKAKEPA